MGMQIPLNGPRLTATDAAQPPVDRLVVGQPIEVALDLLPRVFNLCQAAQTMALRLALGQDTRPGDPATLTDEILREHLLRLALILPRHLGLDPVPFTRHDPDRLRAELFGPAECFPATPKALTAFLMSPHGIAPMLRTLRDTFGPGEATCPVLPPPNGDFGRLAAVENSVALRHLSHPVMRHVEKTLGRGPLWRVIARALDLELCLEDRLPAPIATPGFAVVPAARGLYTVSAGVRDGCLSEFRRVTPTDHLMAPGGIMEHVLASLPPSGIAHADLVCDILDPCRPVTICEAPDA